MEDEEEQEEEGKDMTLYAMAGETLVTRRVLSAQYREMEETQRENLFVSKCSIGGKICRFIIDGGSCTNAAS